MKLILAVGAGGAIGAVAEEDRIPLPHVQHHQLDKGGAVAGLPQGVAAERHVVLGQAAPHGRRHHHRMPAGGAQGGAPCDLGKTIKASGRRLTVHVIGYQLRAFRWTGAQSFLDAKCLAEETGGLYITAENRQDLVEAFEKTLGCPMMSALPSSTAGAPLR